MCRGSTLTTDGRVFANFVRGEGGFTGAIDLGEDRLEAFRRFSAQSQPDSWKKGQTYLSLFQSSVTLMRDEGVDPSAAYHDGTTGLHRATYDDSAEWAGLRKCASRSILLHTLIGAPLIVLRYTELNI
jgi:hypothetical protein